MNQLARPFLNFFLLFVFINPVLIIDSEFFIFLSISLVIILFTNTLSEILVDILRTKLLNYYYYFVRYYNLQLIFIHETTKYFRLVLFLNFLPIFMQCYLEYTLKLARLFKIQIKAWDIFAKKTVFRHISRFRHYLLRFYPFFLKRVRFSIKYLFVRRRISNYRQLAYYISKNFQYKKNPDPSKKLHRNAYLIAKDLDHILKFLKLKLKPNLRRPTDSVK